MNKYLKQVGIVALLVPLASACARVSNPPPLASTTTPVQDPSTVDPGTQQALLTPLPPAATSPASTSTATLSAPVEIETGPGQEDSNELETNRMNIQIGDQVLTAALIDNSSTAALIEALSKGPITINMRDYGSMEKVGSLGMELPRNDEQITAEAGDIILYQGNALVIYYAPNSWNFTRLGKINDLTAAELKEVLGDGNVTVTLSLPQN